MGEVVVPPWLEAGLTQLGVQEYPGSKHNPEVLKYLETTTNIGQAAQSRDETPWCSAFVNWCFAQAWVKGTDHALAASWLSWGLESVPILGAACVIRRRREYGGRRTGTRTGYHVGLFLNHSRGSVVMLSGNTDNRVGIDTFHKGHWETVGFRVPDISEPGQSFGRMTAGIVGASGGKPRKGPPTAYWYISDRDTVVRMDNKNERGQIRVPPRPNKKRRLGAIQIKPGSHPGRRGLYGQRSSSIGYNNMKKLPERYDTPGHAISAAARGSISSRPAPRDWRSVQRGVDAPPGTGQIHSITAPHASAPQSERIR